MGEIWLATQPGPGGFERLVVLKRIITTPDDDPSMLTMFLDEARIASQLHHPNVVQVTELGRDGESLYLAMEYLAGQALGRVARRALERSRELPVRLSLEIVADAAKGLGYAHRKKDRDGHALDIVHRDVSPQNIFVTYEGHTKVLDFGIATVRGRSTRTATGVLKGKVAYMSPEQALGGALGPPVDVFALGVVAFELLTHSRLHGRADDIAIIGKLVSSEPFPRVRDRARVDTRLDALIAKAMALDPHERFADGLEFAEALDEYLRSSAVVPGDVPLRQFMQSVFAEEIQRLPEFEKSTQLTPSSVSSSNRSLPQSEPPVPAPPSRRGPLLAVGVLGLAAVGAVGGVLAMQQSTSVTRPEPRVVLPPVAVVVVDAGAAVAPPEPRVVLPPVAVAVVDAGAAVVPPERTEPVVGALADAGVAPVGEALAVALPVESVDAGAAAPAAGAKAVARRGRLSLECDPWARVYLGKRLLGETPLIEVALPAGRQRLRLSNPDEHLDVVVEVDVVADEVVVKRFAF
jgi:serine/threonine-protein kinase